MKKVKTSYEDNYEREEYFEEHGIYTLYREPTDYNTGAGVKFSRGDIIITTGYKGSITEDSIGRLGIVVRNPGLLAEGRETWENFYTIEQIFEIDEWLAKKKRITEAYCIGHNHAHETCLELYHGKFTGKEIFLLTYSNFLKTHADESKPGYLETRERFLKNHGFIGEYTLNS